MIKLSSVKILLLQRFVAPATLSCKILKHYCTKILLIPIYINCDHLIIIHLDINYMLKSIT